MFPYYDSKIFERVNIAMLDSFDRLQINRYSADGNIKKVIHVPVIFHTSKTFSEYVLNTQNEKESKFTCPIVGLRIGNISRNEERTTTSGQIREIHDPVLNKIVVDNRPSPWKLQYTLSIYTELITDLFQIIENILPYYDPYFTLRIKEFEFSNIEKDIPVTLTGVNFGLNDDIERERHTSYTADLTFDAAVDLYKPIYISQIIKTVKTNINLDRLPQTVIENKQISLKEYNTLTKQIEEGIEAKNHVINEGTAENTYIDNTITPNENNNETTLFVDTTDSDTLPIITLPAKVEIISATINVLEKADDVDTTISIGTSDQKEIIMAKDDSNLRMVTSFTIEPNVTFLKKTALYAYYNKSSSKVGRYGIYINWKYI